MGADVDLFTVAQRHHRAGELDQAEVLYRRLLQARPAHADAWHLLGVLATQRKRPGLAVEYIGKALALRPAAAFHLNLGVAYQALGRRSDALASFEEAVRLGPDLAEAHNNLGSALYEQGRADEAVAHWQRAVTLRSDYADPHTNLCEALRTQGRLAEAVAHGRQAVGHNPGSAQAHFNLGKALADQKHYDGAEDCFRAALRLRPQWAEVHAHLGLALARQDRAGDAATALEEALRLQPDAADAHNALGMVRARQGRPEEALAHFERALWLRPDYADAHNNLALVLKEQRRFGPAVEHFRQALRLEPHMAEAHQNLGQALCRLGRLDEAEASFREVQRLRPGEAEGLIHLGDVLAQQGRLDEAKGAFHEALGLEPGSAGAHACLLNALTHHPAVSSEQLLAEHLRWAEAHARVLVLGSAPDHDRRADRRLRVGYVSADFQGHVVAHFVAPVLAHHDPTAFEVICYAEVFAPDQTTQRLRGLAHRWVSVCGLGDAEVARRIQEDRVDILVDLAGHTGTRLGVFARRPAPVQVTWLGYPATTGLEPIRKGSRSATARRWCGFRAGSAVGRRRLTHRRWRRCRLWPTATSRLGRCTSWSS
jgi:tetratricopeptide (TPR) repeat protein